MQQFTGVQYLQIDIANNFGLDKKTWQERLDWFEEHQEHLHEMLPQAEEPALFYAGIKAYETTQQGQPIGYPISLDATSSGLQILAVLTGDRQAAEICNVVNHGEQRADAYTIVYDDMLKVIGEGSKIKRDDTKRAIMTSLYGSQAVPKEVFGEGQLLTVFLDTMKLRAPAAWELNETFLEIWDSEALSNDWVLPDNFNVHIKVMDHITETVHFLNEPIDIHRKINTPMKEGRSLGANTIHSIDGMIVREMVRRCDHDPKWISLVQQMITEEVEFRFESQKDQKHARHMIIKLWTLYKESGYLSARILDYIDSDTIHMVDRTEIQLMINSLPPKPFKLLTVHDCFRCLPHYGNDLRKQYNLQLHLIAKSKMLGYLLTHLVGNPVEVNLLDETLHQDILEANYALS